MKSFSLSLAAGLTLLSLIVGCGGVAEPAQSARGPRLPNPGADQEYSVDFPDAGRGVERSIHIAIDADLSRSCGLMRTYFAFDSAKLSPDDKDTLRSVAECLERPELVHLQLAIVGRADSRGSDDYNADLGRRRAESVKKLLVDTGIRESRIAIDSRGATGASGSDATTDLYSYGYDRRVDVVLVGVPHAPR